MRTIHPVLRCILCVFGGLCFLMSTQSNSMASIAKSAKLTVAPQTARSSIKIQNTKSFFSWYIRSGQIEKSDFETEQQYKKRLPWFDSSKPVYFRITATEYDDAYKYASGDADWMFSYEIGSQVLSIIGGEYWDASMFHPRKLTPYTPIIVGKDSEHGGSYVGANAYGAEANVQVFRHNEYILNLTNADKLPGKAYDRYVKRFDMSIKVPPQEAKKLSSKLQIVIGVNLAGHERSESYMSDYRKPTVENPYESSDYTSYRGLCLQDTPCGHSYGEGVCRLCIREVKDNSLIWSCFGGCQYESGDAAI
jgi:hypothetical protein